MIKTFAKKYGVVFLQGWGMTEMSPLGTVSRSRPSISASISTASTRSRAPRHSRVLPGLDCKVVGFDGKIAPHGRRDSRRTLRARSLDRGRVLQGRTGNQGALDGEGWFKTGDVVVIDREGYVQIVDRSKDVIKSGGEWISSIDVENAMMAHPDVAEAAVIGLPHPKWDERPLLIVVKKEGRDPKSVELAELPFRQAGEMAIARRSRVRAEIPHGGTGKF